MTAGLLMHDEFSVTDIYRILRERRVSIAAWVLLFGLAAIAWATLSPPSYRASTTLLVGTGLNPLPEGLASFDANYEPLVLDHVAALTSTSLAAEVLEQLGLQHDPEFRPNGYSTNASLDEAGQSELVRNFREKLTVSSTDESNVLEVRFETNDPEKSARIANATAQAYLATQARFNRERSTELADWLGQRTSQLQNIIFDIEMKLAAMRQLKDLPLVESELQLREQEGLNEQMLSLQSEKAEVQAKLVLARRLGRTADGSNIELEDTISSATLRSLVEQKVEANRSIAELSTSYGPKHPLMTAAIAERSQIASQLRQEASNIRRSLQNRLDVISGRETELRGQVASLSDRSSTTYIENIELERYETDLAAKKTRLASLLAMRDSMAQREGLDTRSQTTRVVAPALVPYAPSSPSRAGLIGIALFTGLLFGMFWALIRELLDTRINSPRKLLACAERLPIGQVPLLKGLSKNVSASRRYLVDDSDHEFAAAIRSAQWNFNLQHKNVLSGSVLVTSALPGEGKTTIAAALARSLSLANKSVLLIDANFSHPGAHSELGISLKSTGLSNLFTGKQQFYKLLRKDPITKVHLLSTGPKPQDPAAL
ncbi:MAG: exopolysaccharide transport family protein, partial [Pseudomonadales bacterium]